jgi:hypothetical protein
MKKLVLLVMVLLLAVPAVAQMSCPSDPGGCNVSFDVNVEKDKKICEFTLNAKFFFTFAEICLDPKALADCEVFKCDYNYSNFVCQTGGILEDIMSGSFNRFEGIGQANQAAGFMVNQGNVVAIAATEGTKKSAAMTEVGVEQTNYYNELKSCFDLTSATIYDSFNRFDGIGQVNQSPGSMNNQNNVVAVSAGLTGSSGNSGNTETYGGGRSYENGVLATNDTFLSQNNVFNCAQVNFAYSYNSISSSFNGFTGIGQANQSSGSMNNQANIVSISFAGNR